MGYFKTLQYVLVCNFGVSQGRRTKFDNMGYFDVLSSEMALIFKFEASLTSLWRQNGNMEGLVTLLFFKVERQNLVTWGNLMCVFQKLSIFRIQDFYDVIMTS